MAALVRDERLLPLTPDAGDPWSMRSIAAAGPEGLARIQAWADGQPEGAWRSIDDARLGPVVPDPGAIYTIGENYAPMGAEPERPKRPLVYGKAPSSVAGHRDVLRWDRSITANVDAEVELGVVIGRGGFGIEAADAMTHVLGFTCIDDISSRDPWLDGDQWLLGKSMPGFCPVGPWLVTPDELDPSDLRLRCTIGDAPIQDGRTSAMRTPIGEVIAYLSRHVALRPGDLIATGTPPRLPTPPGPDRRLRPGDDVTVWIEGIGGLRTTVA
jgi:2-keto-4-pentenoate hydratase/2-oxohepta-3-ene-1,7-dioic acid hydratase in catechol pathway